MLSDPICLNDNVRFTMLPFNAYKKQWGNYQTLTLLFESDKRRYLPRVGSD